MLSIIAMAPVKKGTAPVIYASLFSGGKSGKLAAGFFENRYAQRTVLWIVNILTTILVA
jgi:hypothetical protein